jgi:hypothetical protein
VHEQTLTASDAAPFDVFGSSVSISGDSAVIGAPETDQCFASACGAVYVFEFDGANWSQTQKLTASDAAGGDQFGYAVSASGNTILVGARFEDWFPAHPDNGAAYVFQHNGVAWVEQQKLMASDREERDEFGFSVSLNGSTAVVGARLSDCTASILNNCGAAYVYGFNGKTWTEEQKLTATDSAPNDSFGFSVAAETTTLLVGAWSAGCDAGPGCGAAYVIDCLSLDVPATSTWGLIVMTLLSACLGSITFARHTLASNSLSVSE